MLKDRLSVSPKPSPSGSPRPSSKAEISQEPSTPEQKEQNLVFIEEPALTTGIESKPPNIEAINQEAGKNEVITKEKKKKKSSWFNAFYPTYKSRSEDFKRIFKEVPDEERLLVDYSCAVQKEILVHGRLYVTQSYLCFYANIFGWETNIVLKWKNVTAITKEKTAIVIPNAILISTNAEKLFFTSFVARDKVYLMLFRIWQNALMDRQMSNQEMWQWVHQSYGAELGLTSDDEDYIAPGTEDVKSPKTSSESAVEGVNNTPEKMESPNSKALDSTDSDFSDLDVPSHCDVSCDFPHEGRQLLNETLPVNVDQLFTLLFTTSKFYLDFQASRKTTDMVQTLWTSESGSSTKVRKVNQTVNITQAIGPKTSQVSETQTMLQCSKPGFLYSINSESVSGGVPYGDSFVIEVHYCLKKITEKQTSIDVYAQIKFKKSVWGLVKGMIEKNCWSGLEEYFLHLSKALKVECEEMVSDVKRKVKRKRKLHSSPKTVMPVCSLDTPNLKMNQRSKISFEKSTLFIFLLIFLLFVLNVFLLLKLWSLEGGIPSGYLPDLQDLKDPPTTRDEWMLLLKRQDVVHSEEVKRWRVMLEEAIESLKKTHGILTTLQRTATRETESEEIPKKSIEL